MMMLVLARQPRSCNFLHWRDLKIVYKRYASLYFCAGLEEQDNELLTLEVLHRYVELLDKYFGNVCELDIIFNFEKAYYILDEFLMGGEVLETSKIAVSVSMEDADTLQETMEEYMSKPAYWANTTMMSHISRPESKGLLLPQHFYLVSNNDSFGTMP